MRSKDAEKLKAVDPYIKVAESGLEQLPNFEGVVYRGIDMNKIPNLSDKYKIGNIVTEEAFTSSSTVKRGAFKRDTFITITSRTGKDVSFLSDFPKQKEILFKPNTKFRILEVIVDEKTGKRFISMEEVK